MTILVPTGDIDQPQHLFVPYLTWVQETTPPNRQLLITYTGVIALRPPFNVGGHLAVDEVVSYVPYSDGTLQTFSDLPIQRLQGTAVASLGAWHVFPDSDALEATDRARVEISEPQSQLQGKPRVLLLRIDVGGLHGKLLRIPYQVMVRIRAELDGENHDSQEGIEAIHSVFNLETSVEPGNNLPEV
ncbi:hypothetical protein HNP84_004073 [Thermocatellispora tengchongensis]|uniref:Uncharacterized protein n=1 Tax=Thermocatellispora tengchongensis TaxID=1073253 RepID=A0A840P910_9ACTN|nr:hypothetical protein [Thermocatellispora tengchongensis]MBB5134341.1 hypothetical protein [Thermocatellispora tengchongensis]